MSRTDRNSPIVPAASSRWIVRSAQSVNGDGTTMAVSSGCSSAAACIARASSAFIAMRAWVSTCRPDSRAAIVIGAWR